MSAVCTRAKRLKQSKDKGRLEPDKTPAYLFRDRRAGRDSRIPHYKGQYRKRFGSTFDDRPDAALFCIRGL